MSEEKLWHRVKPGGKTKEEFEKGEIIQDGRPATAEELAQTLGKVQRIKANELIAREKERGIREVPKTPEEIEFIGMVQMMIKEERERLGLTPGFYIELERTRLFHSKDWELREGHNKDAYRGEYRILEGLAETKTRGPSDRFSPYAYFKTASHELLHQASHYEADPLGNQMRHRLGYAYQNGWGRGLNEGMTEEINLELLGQHEGILEERFHDKLSDGKTYKWWSENPSYHVFRKVVREVARRTDEILYPDAAKSVTWDNLKRGYFAGDDKALEDIKKALGTEALEMFLLLGNEQLFNTDETIPEKTYWHIERVIERYLTESMTPRERDKMYQEVMSLKNPASISMEENVDKK